MRANSSERRISAARVFGGVVCGALLGAGAGALALIVYPWAPAAFGGEYHGAFTVVLFCVPAVVAYTVVGVILGVVGAFCRRGRYLVGLAVGTAAGLAGALGLIVASRIFFAEGKPSDGVEVFPDGIIIVVMSLVVFVAGAVIGRIWGSAIPPRQSVAADRDR